MPLKSSAPRLSLFSCMQGLFAVLMLTIILSACTPGNLIGGLIGGGGPNVAANTQVGRENIQGVKANTRIDAGRTNAPVASVRPNSRVDNIDQSTNSTEIDPLLLALLIIGWLAPSPGEMWRGVTKLFRKGKDAS